MAFVFHFKRFWGCVFLCCAISFVAFISVQWKKSQLKLSNEVFDDAEKITCLVLTRPHQLESKAKVVYDTWGKRCDEIHFATSRQSANEPLIHHDLPILETDMADETQDTRSMAKKLFKALEKLFRKHESQQRHEWIFISDDDTYVIVENLRRFTRELKAKNDAYREETYGYNFENDFHSGGAGILFHRSILEIFAKNHEAKCQYLTNGPGDLMLAKCLREMGVRLGQSRDENNMDRFLPMSLYDNWITSGDSKVTVNCCSDKTISMHYISPKEMIKLDTLLYKIKLKPN